MDSEEELSEQQQLMVMNYVGRMKLAWAWTGILVFLSIVGILEAYIIKAVFF